MWHDSCRDDSGNDAHADDPDTLVVMPMIIVMTGGSFGDDDDAVAFVACLVCRLVGRSGCWRVVMLQNVQCLMIWLSRGVRNIQVSPIVGTKINTLRW